MALLPEKIRYKLFDSLSLKTMRYVDAVSSIDAGPLVSEIYDQITEVMWHDADQVRQVQHGSGLAA